MGAGVIGAEEKGGIVEPFPPSPQAIHPLLVGASVPSVLLKTEEGEAIDLQAVVAGKPTVLIFYRGNW